MSHEIECSIPGHQFLTEEVDNLQLSAMRDLAANHGMGVKRVGEHMLALACETPYHPFEKYLESLPVWDVQDHIGALVASLELAKDQDPGMARLLIERWLVSNIAAIRRHESDHAPRGVLVLAGPQNTGKTTFFRLLFPRGLFYEGDSLSTTNKDDVKRAVSFQCVELGELDGTFRKADISHLKAFLSRDRDVIRLPYAAKESRWIRRTIFCATVNNREFLVDQTGNTRYWVVSVTGVRYDQYNAVDMDQLWAQVVQMYILGAEYLLGAHETSLLEASNERHRECPVEESRLLEVYDWQSPRESWTEKGVTEIAADLALDKTPNTAVQKRLKEALNKTTSVRECRRRRIPVYRVPPKWVSSREVKDGSSQWKRCDVSGQSHIPPGMPASGTKD